MSNVVLATFGSLGDLYPYLAIGQRLQKRGHAVTIATSEMSRPLVEAARLAFHPVPPTLEDLDNLPERMRRANERRSGSQYVIRQMVLPFLRRSYEALSDAATGADLLVSHILTYAVPLVAGKRGLPWLSTVLQPAAILSAHDPSVLAPAQALSHLSFLGPAFHRPLYGLIKRMVRPWMKPVDDLRAELGLPPAAGHPMFDGGYSPYGTLMLFSCLLARQQPDWPRNSIVTGFPFYDQPSDGQSHELERFLAAGRPPVVFTLGSSAVRAAGNFYQEGVEGARLLGVRAILLVGEGQGNEPPEPVSPDVLVLDYAPHDRVFAHAAAVVHHGGVGTMAEVLRAGKPMLVVPYSHDQPDNAARVARLGAARVLSRERFTASRVRRELGQVLEDIRYADRAREAAAIIRAEDGVGTACLAMEKLCE